MFCEGGVKTPHPDEGGGGIGIALLLILSRLSEMGMQALLTTELLNETWAVVDICDSHCIFVVFVSPPKIGMKKFHFCN